MGTDAKEILLRKEKAIFLASFSKGETKETASNAHVS
jgi:hypothetical protein